jgi:hypothetical protein
LKAAGVVNPLAHLLEDPGKEVLIKVVSVLQREVQILREPVGLEVALLQAGAALEHPARADHRVGRNAGQEPAEGVVLLDHMGLEL